MGRRCKMPTIEFLAEIQALTEKERGEETP